MRIPYLIRRVDISRCSQAERAQLAAEDDALLMEASNSRCSLPGGDSPAIKVEGYHQDDDVAAITENARDGFAGSAPMTSNRNDAFVEWREPEDTL